MTRRYDRLVHTGNAVVDLVLRVDRPPDRGGDVLAGPAEPHTGGAFDVMAAASRLGLPTAYAGAHGTGPNGDRVRADLSADNIALLTPVTPGLDTGLVICLVDDEGERTFVTSPGAESRLRTEHLLGFDLSRREVLYVSGYSLIHPDNCAAIVTLLDGSPGDVDVAFDPGPLVEQLPVDALATVLARATWFSCNAAEAEALTGARDPVAAARALHGRAPAASVIVRADRRGAVLAEPGRPPELVPAVAVRTVDSTGAGDTHTGALLAALAEGRTPREAVEFGNAAAAFAVMHRGPATAPTAAQLREWQHARPQR